MTAMETVGDLNHSSLHQTIISSFLERERAPTVREIVAQFQCDEDQARLALRALAEYHGVVIHPKTDEIWAAHPFSAAPTTCVVKSGTRTWWGNCIWCSLGLVHLAGGSATIETRVGAIEDPVTIRIENGKLVDKDFVVHFPIPMKRAWDNIIYTCSVMLPFRNEAQVDAWCASRGIPRGDVRPIEQIWEFAAEWYGRHSDPKWTKWSVREAIELFARHHLDGPTWSLVDEGERF